MFNNKMVIVALVVLACLAGPSAQAPQGDEAAWRAFMAWLKSTPPIRANPFAAYAPSLQAAGTTDADARRQVGVLMAMMRERSDWVELYYDKIYTIPLTGDPASDGFTTDPSAFVVEAVKGLAPGAALDAGMGQGRNAVYLARQGWSVTGFDLSAEALKAARANAAAAGVQVESVKAGYADFEYGTARWDVIVLIFAWAPIDDPAFLARLRTSLRPGGRIVFEHFTDDPASPRPAVMHALKPGQLKGLLADFRLDRYEEVTDLGDWGGPDSQLVRVVAVK
ncbi:MAG: class I SAM-dependent methyltransferase [Vicinamibacterales bacterium]